jgi:DNA phosphorothioation-associated putative methyltransferase
MNVVFWKRRQLIHSDDERSSWMNFIRMNKLHSSECYTLAIINNMSFNLKEPKDWAVRRWITAPHRKKLSVSARSALDSGVISNGDTILDYGCGRGGDVQLLRSLGYQVQGWDPYHFPEPLPQPADVVLHSYIINVIEDPNERAEVLRHGFSLAKKGMVVAARDAYGIKVRIPYQDGILTGMSTFEKAYHTSSLALYVIEVLGENVVVEMIGPVVVWVTRKL